LKGKIMNKITIMSPQNASADDKLVTVLGMDLAKDVFALHGINAAGKAILVRPNVSRAKLLDVLAALPPCIVGMEACSGAHHWARELVKLGHTPKMMAPKFVSPYRMQGKRGKNDANDAAAICEAVMRPNMRFVPIKSMDAQATLCVHRTRQGFIEERTATINRVRGLMSEFGIVLPQKADTVRRQAHLAIEHLPGWAARTVTDLLAHIALLDERIAEYDQHLKQVAREDDRCTRIMAIPGVGPTTATALLAAIGNGHDFKNGRQLAAWLGLVPGQCSSGGKARLGRITKAGDRYLRTLLILGAKSVLANAPDKSDAISRWAVALAGRAGYGKALVAIAAKNARMIWAMLAKGVAFEVPA
jgi:transposase